MASASQVPSRSAFALCASGLVFLMAGTTIPTPVYVFYEVAWDIGPTEITLIYAAYIGPLVLALLTVGGLSDIVGRRPVLAVSFLISAIGMLAFALADAPSALYLGRLLHGLATGGALGALASGVIDWAPAAHPSWGSIAAAATPTFGLALGGLASGLIVEILPAPTVTPYLVFAAVFVTLAAWSLLIREPAPPGGDVWRSLVPRLGVPRGSRAAFLWLIPAMVVIASVGGQVNALAPMIMRDMLQEVSKALAGAIIAVVNLSSAVGSLTGGRRSPRVLVLTGMAALTIGILGTLTSLTLAWQPGYVGFAATAGYGIGVTFLGCVRRSAQLAPAGRRSAVLATLNLTNFAGLTIPLVFAGIAVAQFGMPAMLLGYTAAQLALIALAVIGQFAQPSGRAPRTSSG